MKMTDILTVQKLSTPASSKQGVYTDIVSTFFPPCKLIMNTGSADCLFSTRTKIKDSHL